MAEETRRGAEKARVRIGRAALMGVSVLALSLLAGCSDVPNWANPVHWYHSTVNAVTGDDEAPPPQPMSPETQAMAKAAAAAPTEKPNLGNVPPRPTVAPQANLTSTMQGLVADRSKALYTDQELRAGPEPGSSPAASPAPPAAAAPAAKTASAPPAASAAPAPPREGTAPLTAVAASPAANLPASAPSAPAPATPAKPAQPQAAPSQAIPAPAAASPAPKPSASAAAAPAAPTPAPAPVTTQGVYRAQLAASAATHVTAPSTGFAPSAAVPVPSFATDVPPIVRETYNAAAGAPGAYAAPAAGSEAFAAAGSRLKDTLAFARGSSRLGAQNMAALRRLAREHRAEGGTFRVVGLAVEGEAGGKDAKGRQLAAFNLADRRATTVARTLEHLGVPAHDISVEARPETSAAEGTPGSARIFLEH